MSEDIDLKDFQSKVQQRVTDYLRLEEIEQAEKKLETRLQKIADRKRQISEQKLLFKNNKGLTDEMLVLLEQAQREVEERRKQLGNLTPREQRELRERMHQRGLELELDDEEEEDV
jgi:hypothetical protein